MREHPVDDFFAHGGKICEDGRMVHDMYLMRIKKPEESKSKWDLYEYQVTVRAIRRSGRWPKAAAPISSNSTHRSRWAKFCHFAEEAKCGLIVQMTQRSEA